LAADVIVLSTATIELRQLRVNRKYHEMVNC